MLHTVIIKKLSTTNDCSRNIWQQDGRLPPASLQPSRFRQNALQGDEENFFGKKLFPFMILFFKDGTRDKKSLH